MKTDVFETPRKFEVGLSTRIELSDCGRIALEPDEQVTFVTACQSGSGGGGGAELDVTRKAWGFYATPSLNSRLVRNGLRAALVRNRLGHFFIVLVEQGKEALFEEYAADEELMHVAWMDNSEALERIATAVARK